MIRAIPNRFDKPCFSCGCHVPVNAGFAAVQDNVWKTYCSSSQCLPPSVYRALTARYITSDGRVYMPYDQNALEWVRQFPGAQFVRPVNDQPYWIVSMRPEDRQDVLDIARILKLDVAPELLSYTKPNSAVEAEVQAALDRGKAAGSFPYQLAGIRFIAERARCLLGDDMGTGKGQPYHAKVLTPEGWITMADVQPGTVVVNPAGGTATVLQVFPQGVRPVYRFTFSDGTSCEADDSHLWEVTTSVRRARGASSLVMSTVQLMQAGLHDAAGTRKWHLPMPTAVDFPERELPIHPYALGALLGDGSLRTNCVNLHKPDTAVIVRASAGLRALGVTTRVLRRDGKYTGVAYNKTRALRYELEQLGLRDTRSHTKFIPRMYLHASRAQRIDLLHGLMDTDGCRCSASNAPAEFSTASQALAEDLAELVRSLGGVARTSSRTPYYTYKGERRPGKQSWRVTVRMPADINPFWLKRKADSVVPVTKYHPAKLLESIEYVRDEPTKCILLDSANHLYITDNYVVTHNTAQSLLAIPSAHGTLVIVPASVKYNWLAECKRWRPDLKPVVLHSSHLPDPLWPHAGEVWIINPDSLPDLPPVRSERNGALFIICDEAHLYKNTRTKRHKAVRAWNDAATKVCIMTGTPMTNRPQDLWGTLAVAGLATKAFGTRAQFEDMFERSDRNELVDPSPEVPKRLRQVMLRRTQDEVLKELPPSVHKQHLVSKVIPPALAEKLDELYAKVEKTLHMDRLPHLEDMSYVRSLLATFKITEMHELIEEYEEAELPLIVFSAHKEPVLSAAQRKGWASITGETKPQARQDIVNAFQSGQLKGVALTVQAGGVGLTLTRAAHMLFVDLDWTPALNAQAEARIKRIGQKASRVHYTTMVVRHPVDERVLQLLEHKTRLFRESIDDVADEYKVPEAQRITGTFTPAAQGPAPYIETPEQREARVAAQRAQDAVRAEFEQKKRRLLEAHVERMDSARAKVEQHKRDAMEAHQRWLSMHSAQRWNEALKVHTPAYQHRRVDPDRLRDALAYMLGRCDGAVRRDDVGFNATDAQVARQMVYLDVEKNSLHAEALARMLYKYKRQLLSVIPELFNGGQDGNRGHAPSGV